MKEQGIVIEIKNSEAIVEVSPSEACSKCCSCGAGRPRKITLPAGNLKAGDKVEVEVDTSSMMKVYCLLYGIPLVVFVSTLIVTYYFSNSPIISFVGGIAGTAISCLLAGIYLRRRSEFIPQICKKIEQ